jgi:NADP-dependent 3-hydroxy acid dehydrogenase YdfG
MELARGNVAVVTGAASGIGFAMAERFATAGLHIVLADVQDDALAAAAEKIAAHGVETLTVRTDVSQEADVQALAAPPSTASAGSSSCATTLAWHRWPIRGSGLPSHGSGCWG